MGCKLVEIQRLQLVHKKFQLLLSWNWACLSENSFLTQVCWKEQIISKMNLKSFEVLLSSFSRNLIRIFNCSIISWVNSGASGLLLFEVQSEAFFLPENSQFFLPFIFSDWLGSFLRRTRLIKGVTQNTDKLTHSNLTKTRGASSEVSWTGAGFPSGVSPQTPDQPSPYRTRYFPRTSRLTQILLHQIMF